MEELLRQLPAWGQALVVLAAALAWVWNGYRKGQKDPPLDDPKSAMMAGLGIGFSSQYEKERILSLLERHVLAIERLADMRDATIDHKLDDLLEALKRKT